MAIDDLAEPRFSPEVTAVMAAMTDAARRCPLEPDRLREAAVDSTGLEDFGDPAFGARLDVLCSSLALESGLSAMGTVSWYSQLVQFLANRLLVQDLLIRHPEIHEERIERPIIICGLPRTGTTHLHNLLSADPALRHLPYWESLQPVLPDNERPGPGEPDPRRARTAQALELLDAAMPLFKRMHDMTVDHAHEEIQLLAIDLSSMLFETMAPVPSWRDHYKASDQTPSYAYLRTVLKVLQWLRGGTRWVLKSPQHLEQFGPLVATFPDATFVVTHRDPVAVTISVATMVTYTARLAVEQVDPVSFGRYWSDRTEDLVSACGRDRHVLPASRSIDVRFDDFMADDMGTVARIYELAGQPLPDASRAAMAAFARQHPRGRHGAVAYDPEALGIDPAERRAALAPYTERFKIAPDERW